jgi:hypothetical protein
MAVDGIPTALRNEPRLSASSEPGSQGDREQHLPGQDPNGMINWQPVTPHADLRSDASLATTLADAEAPSLKRKSLYPQKPVATHLPEMSAL